MRTDVLWAVAGFCVVQLVLALAIEFRFGRMRDPEFAEKINELRLRRAETPGVPLIVALGSSRTEYGLQADQLGRGPGKRALVFNLAMSGGGPLLEQLSLRRLLAEGIRPDFAFVEINAGSLLLQENGRPMEENWLDGARLKGKELAWVKPYYSRFARLFLRWGWSRLLPCRSQQAALHQLLDTYPAEEVGRCGWKVQFDAVTEDQRKRYSDLARRQYEGVLKQFRFAPKSLKALEDLLGLCKGEGIPFALVVMPEAGPFRALYPPAGREEFQALLDRLGKTWQVPVIDARTWVADAGFWDTHHMLPTGAMAFTQRFGREVVEPLLARGLH